MHAKSATHHIVDVEVVDVLGTLHPLHNVVGRCVEVVVWIPSEVADPGGEIPRQSVQLDVGVALLRLRHQPPARKIN